MKQVMVGNIGLTILLFVSLVVLMPHSAMAASLLLVDGSYGYSEVRKFNEPDLPFSENISPEGFIGWLLDEFGISPVGSIYGPGISEWNNGVEFFGNTTNVYASAVGTVAWINFWDFHDTQYVKYDLNWHAAYEFSGAPGETSDIWFNYFYNYTYFNLAAIGRSKSITALDFSYWIIPNGSTAPSYSGSLPLYFSKQYDFIGGFKESSGSQQGIVDLNTMMGDGDRLYVSGTLKAYTECENYFEGLTVATMFPSFGVGIYVTPSDPVPEPTSLLLLGTGIVGIGLAAWRKRKA